jgi:ubiquinone/menaquinone biosynthesis C-methylase UbiE
MAQQQCWRYPMEGNAPELYERCNVPGTFRPLAQLFLEHVGLRTGERVLDVACGTGIVARLAAPQVGLSGTVVGLDLNTGMLDVARAQPSESGATAEWRQGDATALPFADAAFDVVCCQQGLQFFPDKGRALREMSRVLVPGGRLALSVWGGVDPYSAAMAEALARYVSADAAARVLAPYALSDAETVRTLVIDAGFRTVDMRTAVLTRRSIGPPETSIPQGIAGSSYAAAVAAMDPAARTALVRDISAALYAYREGEGFAWPAEVHIVIAQP